MKYPEKQSEDPYDLMRKFAIILLNDILKNCKSRVRQEFQQLMKPGDEDKIKTIFASNEEYIQDDDITISVDQSESLYRAISQNGLEFHAVDEQGNFDSAQLLAFLERLCKIFKWKIFTKIMSGGNINLNPCGYSKKKRKVCPSPKSTGKKDRGDR